MPGTQRNGFAVGGGGIAWGSLVKLSSASRRDGPVFDDEGADDVTVTCSHDRGHEAGRLGSHDPGDLPPGGQVSGEALQSAEEEVRRYLLDVRERNARGSFKTSHYGIQFFYRNTLDQDWALFKKRSGFPSRGGCRRRFTMPKCGAFSPRSAIRYTAAVSA